MSARIEGKSGKLHAQAGLDYIAWTRRNGSSKDADLAWQTYDRLVVEFQVTDAKPDVIQAVVSLGLAELEASQGRFAQAKELLRNKGATPQPLWQEMRKVEGQVNDGLRSAEDRSWQEDVRRREQLSPAERRRQSLEAQKKQCQDLRQNLLNSLNQPNQSERERQILRDSVARYDQRIADIDKQLDRLSADGSRRVPRP